MWTNPSVASAFDRKCFWGGLEGVITEEEIELAPGLIVEPCYASIFAHPILAVNPPTRPGSIHPAPWFNCRGGDRVIEVRCQIRTDADATPLYRNRVSTMWLAAAALRLLLCAPLRLAVLSDTDFADLTNQRDTKPAIISLEQQGSYSVDAQLVIDGYAEAWRSLIHALAVAMRDERFQRAFSYLDAAWWAGSGAGFLVSIWTSLEALLLSPNTVGIKRALATRISELLAQSRSERDRLFNQVLELYGKRCDSAHEAKHPDFSPIEKSAKLAGAVFFAKAGEAVGERW